MKNNNDNFKLLLSGLAGLVAQFAEIETPKTSAKLKGTNEIAELKTKKGKRVDAEIEDETNDDIIEIHCLENRPDPRVRIPKAAFNSRGVCFVDGVKYEARELDGFRSTKLSPATFDAESGDTVILTRIKGNQWESEVARKKKSKGTKAKSETKKETGKGTSKKLSSKPESKKTASKSKGKTKKEFGTLDEQLDELADAAIKQARKGFKNEYIEEYSRFDKDARLYLTTAQNRRIKGMKYANNLTLGQIVEMLNERVFED